MTSKQLAEYRRLAERSESAVPMCSEYQRAIAALLTEVDRLRGEMDRLRARIPTVEDAHTPVA